MKQKLDLKVSFDGKIYDMRISVQAQKEQADLILQAIYQTLRKRGLIVE